MKNWGEELGPVTNRRWRVVGFLFMGTTIYYLDRVNLSVAATTLMKVFHTNLAVMGLLLSAFAWSFTVLQLPVGSIVDRIGVKLSYAISGLWWGVASILTALASSVPFLVAVRLFLGVGESPSFITNVRAVSEWMPPQERGLASGLFTAGIPFGSAVTPPIVVFLLLHFGWQSVFVISGLLALLWAVAWIIDYRPPLQDSRVGSQERQLIGQVAERHPRSEQGEAKVEWWQLLKIRNVWATALGYFFMLYILSVFVLWLPSYLQLARHIKLYAIGYMASVPWAVGTITVLLGGWLTDWLIRHKGWRPLASRKVVVVIGMLVAMAIVPAAFSSSNSLAIILLTVSVAGIMFANGAAWAVAEDVAPPNRAGSVAGIQAFFGNVAGILAPILTGFVAQSTHSFVLPLVIGGVAALLGAFVYLVAL